MENEAKTKGEKWLDIGMGWLVRYEHSDGWLDFKAYEVIGIEMHPVPDRKMFHKKGARFGSDHVYTPEEADSVDGYVKWDGCMEISIRKHHFCGARDVADHCVVLAQLHALCLLLPSVDRDCADYPPVPT